MDVEGMDSWAVDVEEMDSGPMNCYGEVPFLPVFPLVEMPSFFQFCRVQQVSLGRGASWGPVVTHCCFPLGEQF